MSNVNQIYTLVNAVMADVWGTSEAPSVKDVTGLISVGQTIANDGTWTADADKFLNSLVDRIGKTVIRTLDRRVDLPKLIMLDYEFGAILQKIDVQPLDAVQDNSFNIGENGYTTDYFNVYKPNVTSELFSGFNVWTVKCTIPDTLFRTAFTSESAMTSFISAITDSISGSIENQIDKMNHINLCNFIAEKVKATNGIINLVTLYNGTIPEADAIATGETALYNKEFLRFASRIINDYIYYLGDDNTFYHVGDKIRATARDNMHVIFLRSFASATSVYLSSDTFHNDLVSLPLYDEVGYLQADGTTFADKAKINMIPTSGGNAIVVNNVIGGLFDRMALGTTIKNRWSASDRINTERRTNFCEGAEIGYFCDTTENAIIFTLN